MSNKLIFLILIIMRNGSASAQSTYNRTFDFFNESWDDALFIYKDDTLTHSTIFHGSFQNPFDTINDSLLYSKIYFAETDSLGSIKRLTNYGRNKFTYLLGAQQYVFKLNDTLYETLITFYDTMDRRTNQVWCININTFDTLYSITLNIPNTYIHDDMLKRNGNYYFIGNIGNTVGDRLFFLVVDSSGKRLINKILPSSYKGSFQNMQWAEDKLLIGGFNSQETNWINSFGWYALFDTLGNIIWEKTTTNDSFFYDVSGIEALTTDTAYYIFSSRSESRPQYLNNYNLIGSIDITNGNIKWKKQYEYQHENPKFNSPFRYHKGNLYSIGNLLIQPGTQNEIQYATLSKYDLNGNPIWNRLFKRGNYDNRIWNLQFMENSIFITGDAKDSSFSDADAWIIKTDTFGCVIPGCQLFDNVPQIIAPQIIYMVYPNPADNNVTIEYKLLNSLPIQFIVTNTLGYIIENITVNQNNLNQKYTFDTSVWPSGIYILTILQKNTPIGNGKIIIQH